MTMVTTNHSNGKRATRSSSTVAKKSSVSIRKRKLIQDTFEAQSYQKLRSSETDVNERKDKLKVLLAEIISRESLIRDALYEDLRKPEVETNLSEIQPVVGGIRHILAHLHQWMKPHRIRPTFTSLGSRSHVQFAPRGTCLVLSPWNFPFHMAMHPLTAAIAAGNTVTIKPSEFAPRTGKVIRDIVEAVFPDYEATVLDGDANVTQELLKHPFDHIFFAGTPEEGKVVMKAAAGHLSSVTLELGGENPLILDRGMNLEDVARKVVWGKFFNCGQSSVAPNYMLVHESEKEQLMVELKNQIRLFFGESRVDWAETSDFSRIINGEHYKRIVTLYKDAIKNGATLELGGDFDEQDFYISPTLISDVPLDSRIMHEEIFGPVLPVNSYGSLNEAIEYVRGRERPLALYVFSNNRKNIQNLMKSTSSGSVVVNDVARHFFQDNVPLGGVNHSGTGSIHGFYSYRTFSYERVIFQEPGRLSSLSLLFPPYTHFKELLSEFTSRYL